MKKETYVLASLATFLLTSLLILSGCGRSSSDGGGVPNGLQQDFGQTGQDFSNFDYGEGELPLDDPTLAPNSNGQEQPGLLGLDENNAVNGPMNMSMDNPTASDFAQAMQPQQQLFSQMKTLEPANLPQAIQDVMKLWWCQAQAANTQYTSFQFNAQGPNGVFPYSAYDFVTGHYLDILGRFPEYSGHQHWMNKLLTKGSRYVSLGILRSEEHAFRKARQWAWHFLRRTPSQSTLNSVKAYFNLHRDEVRYSSYTRANEKHTGSIYGGNWSYSIEWTMSRFLSDYEGSLFWNRAKAAANHQVPQKYQEYVRRAVAALVGRNPTYWEIERLRQGKNYHSSTHRRQTALDIIHSDEYRLKFIASVIRVFLNRNATGADYLAHMSSFRQGYDMMSVMADILSSNAYAYRQVQRFSPVSNQCN